MNQTFKQYDCSNHVWFTYPYNFCCNYGVESCLVDCNMFSKDEINKVFIVHSKRCKDKTKPNTLKGPTITYNKK